ncbi:hypothetical protein LTR66_008866 [Elasticomyces elasticus]|nr:hypothetical protein LTR66_008866 [Elasticomyces elasticus]
MLLRLLGATALALQCATAFRDSSPFFFYSSPEIVSDELASAQVASAKTLESQLLDVARLCISNSYVVVEQPGVSATDFASSTSTPHLQRILGGATSAFYTAVTIPDVIGRVDAGAIVSTLGDVCKAVVVDVDGSSGIVPDQDAGSRQVFRVHLSALPTHAEERASKLAQHDSYVNALLSSLPSDEFILFYISTPPTSEQLDDWQYPPTVYEMDQPFPSALHTDLKRDFSVETKAGNHSNSQSDLPLFEKYQFLSSGIFMGLVVSLLLLLILYVGISAISSVEVSYMAFNKEMGPAAQKKQQQ